MTFPAALRHGPITRVVDGVHHVRGSYPMAPGIAIGRTMTIVETPDGLVLLNAVRLSAAGEAELERLGKIKHVIRLSDSHGYDEPYYLDRDKPEYWTLPDAVLPSGVRATQTLGPASPIPGAVVFDYPGTSGWKECGLWLPHGGGTVITTDALQNHIDVEGTSILARIFTPMLGFRGGVIVAPMWRKLQNVHGPQVAEALSKLVQHEFENLVTGHGPAVVGRADVLAKAAVARAGA